MSNYRLLVAMMQVRVQENFIRHLKPFVASEMYISPENGLIRTQ